MASAAHVGMTRGDLLIGAGVAAAIHVALAAGLWLTPTQESLQPETDDPNSDGCAAVVSPACVGLGVGPTPSESVERHRAVQDRRCPEPLRRGLRRDPESPPAVAVDLLQAELVAALGVETGTRSEPKAVQKLEVAKPKLAEAIGDDTKLGDMLKDGADSDAKKKKLGDILGRPDGKVGGEGKVNMPGSAYVREVKTAVTANFSLPASLPPWEAAGLIAKVRVTRMTASGGVLEWRLDKSSGNDEFDGAVRALMNGYKSGSRSLPEPPPHILEEINSRGFVIELRGGKG